MFLTVSQLRTILAIADKLNSIRKFDSVNVTKHFESYYFDVTNGAVASRFIVTDGISGKFPEGGSVNIPRTILDQFMKIVPKGKKTDSLNVLFEFGTNNTVIITVATADINVPYSIRGFYATDVKFPSFDTFFNVTKTETESANAFALFASKNMSLFEDFLKCNGAGVFGKYSICPYNKFVKGGLIAFIGEDNYVADSKHYRAVFLMLPYQFATHYGIQKMDTSYN